MREKKVQQVCKLPVFLFSQLSYLTNDNDYVVVLPGLFCIFIHSRFKRPQCANRHSVVDGRERGVKVLDTTLINNTKAFSLSLSLSLPGRDLKLCVKTVANIVSHRNSPSGHEMRKRGGREEKNR